QQHLAGGHAVERLLGLEQWHGAVQTTQVQFMVGLYHKGWHFTPAVPKNREITTGIMRNICGLHRKDFFLMRYSMPSTAFKPRRLAAALALGTLFLAPAAPVPAQINLPVLGDSISGTISTEQEYRFGREFLRSVRRQSKIMDDPLIAEYIASL